MASIIRSLILLTASVLLPSAHASVLSFTGDLRTDPNFIGCGFDCVLGPANTDADYAQWAAASVDFAVPVASTMTAITFSYGGGINGNGAVIAEGGFEPYLSLFDGSGNFLASTGAGTTCPAGSRTNSMSGFCYDVDLDGGILAAGTYNIAISAFENMSLAENPGGYLLSDGFTGLGNLASGEDMHYAFDVILTTAPPPVPEPSTAPLVLAAATGIFLIKRMRGTSK